MRRMKTVPEMDSGDGYTTMKMYFMPLNCILQKSKCDVVNIPIQMISI